MLTVILSDNHTADDLLFTLKSLSRGSTSGTTQVIVLSNAPVEQRPELPGIEITWLDGIKDGNMKAFASSLEQARGEYVLFANSGDVFSKKFFTAAGSLLSEHEDIKSSPVCVASFSSIGYEDVKKAYSKDVKPSEGFAPVYVDLRVNPQLVPKSLTGVIFKTKALREVGIDSDITLDGINNAMVELLAKSGGYRICPSVVIQSPYPLTTDSVNFPNMHKPEWYFNSTEKFILSSLRRHRENGRAMPFVQYLALFEMKWRFIYNLNGNDKHIVDSEHERFISLCREVFLEIDNNILFNLDNYGEYRMTTGLSLAMFHIKFGSDFQSEYAFDNYSILRLYDNLVLARSRQLKVILEVLEHENGVFTIDASIDDFLDMRGCELECYLNNERYEFEETYRFAHTKYFGVSTNKRYTFRVSLPDSVLEKPAELTFFLRRGSYSVALPLSTRRYTARFSTAVSNSYYLYNEENGGCVYASDNKKSLCFTHIGKSARVKREVKLMLGMLTGREKAPGMMLTRMLYWVTRPHYKKKRIWLTYDKLYKGGDCGEYFYKYMKSQNDGITPVYVINRDTEDVKRLRKEGFRPTYFGTMKNRLQYLNAEVVFATHGGVHTFNGISNSRAKFVCDLMKADVTCIQHGLSVQQLAQELNRHYNNTKRYYCASKYEIKNLEHPIYGYEDKSVLRLTGIPRYDGLVSDDQKQILITPTWRAYISMPPVMGKSRPYYPEFKNTDYYKFYYKLLTDERLIETARRTGYRLIYLLHPIISSQIIDYPEIDGVEIIPATEVNYEKILTESSLMLTDYSGVQFDFAYMRKPVVYYHPPELPPHYKEGGFFYDSMGFGEICTEHEGMVSCLCEYMENGCQMKPFYRDRADDFFAYSDLDSCKRIYDDMTEYLKNKR